MENSLFQSLEDKLQKLLQHYELLKKENRKLKVEKEENTILLAQASEKNFQLLQQNNTLKMGLQNLNSEDKKMLQSRIDGYLKEIDKCLALLET